jgi:hypothetical protein
MIKFLFYFIAIFFLFYEVWILHSYNDYANQMKRLDDIHKNGRVAVYHDNVFILINTFYIIFTIAGLIFSSQWILFAVLIFISMFPKHSLKNEKIKKILTICCSFICSLLLLFMILNAYHFHIDVFHLIFN